MNTVLLYTLIMFSTQLVFIGFRTVNVLAVAKKDMKGALLSGAMVHIAWLVGIAIGGVSMYEVINDFKLENLLIVLGSLSGGLLGTYLGLKDFNYVKMLQDIITRSRIFGFFGGIVQYYKRTR